MPFSCNEHIFWFLLIVVGWSIHKDCMAQFQFGPATHFWGWQYGGVLKGVPQIINIRPLKYWKPWFWGTLNLGNLQVCTYHIYYIYIYIHRKDIPRPPWSMLLHVGPCWSTLIGSIFCSTKASLGPLAKANSPPSWLAESQVHPGGSHGGNIGKWPCRMIDIKPVL